VILNKQKLTQAGCVHYVYSIDFYQCCR